MFRRGMASLALAAILSLAVFVPAVMADTFGGNGDLYTAFGGWGVGDSNVNVGVTVGTSEGQAVHALDIGSFIVQDITCNGKGKKAVPGIILTYIFGESTTAAITINKDLGTATASGTIVAQRRSSTAARTRT